MPNLRIRSWVSAPVDEVFTFYDDPVNLGRLMPPPVRFRLVRVEPGTSAQRGSIFEFRYGLGPIQRPWIVRLTDRVENERFVDETLSGPMARFQHSHTFTPGRRGTWIEDRVDFHVGPDGPVGVALDFVAGLAMRLIFVWRGDATAAAAARVASVAPHSDPAYRARSMTGALAAWFSRFPEGWWGYHWAPPRPMSAVELIGTPTIDSRLMATLWAVVSRRRSVMLSSEAPQAGKTTALSALVDFLPDDTTGIFVRGWWEEYDWLDEIPAGTGYLLINEMSDHLPIYVWGRARTRRPDARRQGLGPRRAPCTPIRCPKRLRHFARSSARPMRTSPASPSTSSTPPTRRRRARIAGSRRRGTSASTTRLAWHPSAWAPSPVTVRRR